MNHARRPLSSRTNRALPRPARPNPSKRHPTAKRRAETSSAFSEAAAGRWMREHADDYLEDGTDEPQPTQLAEACAAAFGVDGVGGPLDDPDHWIWDAAIAAFTLHHRKNPSAPVAVGYVFWRDGRAPRPNQAGKPVVIARYASSAEAHRALEGEGYYLERIDSPTPEWFVRKGKAIRGYLTPEATRENPSAKPARAARRNLRPNPGLLYVTVSDHAGDTKSVNGAQLAIDVRSFERAMGSKAARWVSPNRDGDRASAELSKKARRLSSIERGATVYVRAKHIEGTAPHWQRVTVL